MKLTLIRDTYTSKSTIGRLFIDGVEFCYTLEDVVRPKGVKVYGDTAIPEGKYSFTLSYSPRFKQLVKDLAGIHLHTPSSVNCHTIDSHNTSVESRILAVTGERSV